MMEETQQQTQIPRVIWDDTDSGPMRCLANIGPSDNDYRSCGKKLVPKEDEFGGYWDCPKHGPMM
jgi:hypothetical protein